MSSRSQRLRSASAASDSCSQTVPWTLQVSFGNTWGRLLWNVQSRQKRRTVSETPCPVCPQPQMLLVPPRARLSATWLVKPRSRSACVFTCLTWRKSAVCQSDAYPPRHSLLFFCLSLSVCGPPFVFVVLFFVLLGQQRTATVSWPSSFTGPQQLSLCFLARFSLFLTLSQFNSLSRLFFLLNLGLSPPLLLLLSSLSSPTCCCRCW